ncbi:MAG: biotin--[acetyl-CoA-carboxylase] ligase [Armatimonadota bacterium]
MKNNKFNLSKTEKEITSNKVLNNLIKFNSIPSTNDFIKKNYKKLKHGTVITAQEQTKGRGRFKNKWFSPKDKGLYFSVLIKKNKIPHELLNIIPAYTALKTIYDMFKIKAQIKWPNDILIEGRKAGGVLVETKFASGRLLYAVIGIGLNINGKPSDLPENLKSSACFISKFTGKSINKEEILLKFIKNLEEVLVN